MKYKIQRENQEICTASTDSVYKVGEKVEIKLPNGTVHETVKILEIIE